MYDDGSAYVVINMPQYFMYCCMVVLGVNSMRGFALNVHFYVMYPVKHILNFNTSRINVRACTLLLSICTVTT